MCGDTVRLAKRQIFRDDEERFSQNAHKMHYYRRDLKALRISKSGWLSHFHLSDTPETGW
ncbi:hypothetical protein M404DRAFT_996603 [Pisolithus tinctorius Marx 270]|uniref:Uncharacterized protein n=1 Tax=Pisolithus tinctorius Marx 270 TaxID=870435 RepID=A0A0C3PN02_PISTI|nr:hypothetical protein M404DRAFT_996603 [Pisolithus tinctorius Marx 270]